eukprot:ctg_2755.g572
MVHRIHGHAAGVRTPVAPAIAAGLAQRLILVLRIAHGAHGGHAVPMHITHFFALQAEQCQTASLILLQQLGAGAGGAAQLSAVAGPHFDVVHPRADGQEPQRAGVARRRVHRAIEARQQLLPNLDALWAENVRQVRRGAFRGDVAFLQHQQTVPQWRRRGRAGGCSAAAAGGGARLTGQPRLRMQLARRG